MSKIKVLVTLGPASLKRKVIEEIDQLGVDLYRINLSHTKMEDLPKVIEEIRNYSRTPICLDTEGAQIRTGDSWDSALSVLGYSVMDYKRRQISDKIETLLCQLYPPNVFQLLKLGDHLQLDFNGAKIKLEKWGDYALYEYGEIGKNKGVHLMNRDIELPPLTEKDEAALKLGQDLNIKHVALSFCNKPADLDILEQHLRKETQVIAKIETQSALYHLDDILQKVETILIDRGDLSRYVKLEDIPFVQRRIVKRAQHYQKEVYVATNLLESMVTRNEPTRAEVNDVISSLIMGVNGLVLAAETAIGKYPVKCVAMIHKLITAYEAHGNEYL